MTSGQRVPPASCRTTCVCLVLEVPNIRRRISRFAGAGKAAEFIAALAAIPTCVAGNVIGYRFAKRSARCIIPRG